MSYGDADFWKAYSAYVDENIARHGRTLKKLGGLTYPVLDLGCGQVMEGHRLTLHGFSKSLHKTPAKYRGVDLDPKKGWEKQVLKADYRAGAITVRNWCHVEEFYPSTILSLFSIEPTGNHTQNELLYWTYFRRFPLLRQIISAGFYYSSKKDRPLVEEAGGLDSYQTIGPLLDGGLHEYRLEERGPSKLFGPDVIEVWRLLTRAERKR